MKALLTAATFGTLCLTLAACTVQQTEAPPITGPSDLALSLRVEAIPDAIGFDGGSQSAIRIFAFGPDGKPVNGVTFRVDMAVETLEGLVAQDFGALSARTIVTGSNGQANVIYTAPSLPTGANAGTCRGLPGRCVTIVATPTSNNFDTAAPQTTTIRLIPLGVILPPADTPTARFSFTPPAPTAFSAVLFDGSTSCPAGVTSEGACVPSSNVLTQFAWDFGDGQTGSGQTATHTYTAAGAFSVTLTVTNNGGLSASTTRQVQVGAGAAPTASFVFSPTPVLANVNTFFDASNSRAAPGRRIVQYQWNWGDGSPLAIRTTPLEDHDFAIAGAYTVVLTVTDDVGQVGAANQTISVGSGSPTATFTIAKGGGGAVTVDGSGSTAAPGATIVSHSWVWGDGSANSSGTAATHTYTVLGTYTIRLTVTDSLGRTGSVTQTVTVP